MSASRRRAGREAPTGRRPPPRPPQPYCEVHGGCEEKAAVWFRGTTMFDEPVTLWACGDHQLEFRLRHPEMQWGVSKF